MFTVKRTTVKINGKEVPNALVFDSFGIVVYSTFLSRGSHKLNDEALIELAKGNLLSATLTRIEQHQRLLDKVNDVVNVLDGLDAEDLPVNVRFMVNTVRKALTDE